MIKNHYIYTINEKIRISSPDSPVNRMILLSTAQLLMLALAGSAVFFHLARRRALALRRHTDLHSLPHYHGSFVFLWALVPTLFLLLVWPAISNFFLQRTLISGLVHADILDSGAQALAKSAIHNYLSGISASLNDTLRPIADAYQAREQQLLLIRSLLSAALVLAGGLFALTRQNAAFRARNHVERYLRLLMLACAGLAVLTTFGIVFSVLFESLRFFGKVNPASFFFGTHWSPFSADASFGLIPLITGTLLISLIALAVAVPVGLMTAIYLSEYATPKVRAWAKPMLEILAGIPTVVYGFFAAVTVAPLISRAGDALSIPVASSSALAAGVVMGIMIIPFVSSLSDDVINAVPQALREGSYGLGATRSETIRRVVMPAALPGVVSSILLAASRAIGETMIVVMAAGMGAKLSFNPLEAVTTVTVQIVTLLQGDQEFDSPHTLAAFALGISLFVITFLLNLFALHIVKKYREQYD